MTADTEQKTEMNTERSNVRAGFAADPKDTEVTVIVKFDQFRIVDGSDTELTLDGANKRRALEERTGERFQRRAELLFIFESVVKADNSNVFLA